MAKGFIPLAKQMDFLWSELQGKEKAGFGKFLTAGVNTPEDYATLWDQTYERSGGAGDAKARDYAGSVYAAMADGTSNQALISPNAKFTYGYLTNKGMTPQQAAGVTGRLMAESYEEMNPDARNTMAGGNGTYGVAQWRGSRMNDLANFAGVDVGGITSLPATTPGGGLLTSSGGANMMPMDPTKKPYMMGGDQTYSFDPQASQQAAQQAQPQQAQPQQGGLGGLLSSLKDRAMAVDPQTGLTGLEQFAVALDPLIMTELRGGEAIQQRGAQRVSAGNKNRTIEMLRTRGRDDLADMVERGMISISDAAGQLLTVPKDNRPSLIQNYEYFKSLGLSDKDAMAQVRSGTTINTGDIGTGDFVYGAKAGLPVGWQIDRRTGKASVIPGGPADIESAASAEAKDIKKRDTYEKDLTFFGAGERILRSIDEKTLIPATGTVAAVAAVVPGLGQFQKNVQEDFAQLQAQMQMAALQNLRETSQNGSSGLGQLTDAERTAIGKVKYNLTNLKGEAEAGASVKSAMLLKAYFEGGLFDPSINGYRVASESELSAMVNGVNPFGNPEGPQITSDFSQFLPKYVAPQEAAPVELTQQQLMEKYK